MPRKRDVKKERERRRGEKSDVRDVGKRQIDIEERERDVKTDRDIKEPLREERDASRKRELRFRHQLRYQQPLCTTARDTNRKITNDDP